MGYMSFNEYVEKQKGQKKPKIAVVADYDGPSSDSPKLGDMPKDSGGKGQHGKPHPYKSGKDAPNRNKDDKSALGHKGNKSNQYMPKATHSNTVPSKKLASYPNVKTQEWVDRTKNMSLPEFTKRVRSERLQNLGENAVKAYESIKETTSFCGKSDTYVADLVLEMKRKGVFEKVFKIMAQQNESFRIVGNLMKKNESFARKLLLNITEITAGSVGMGDEGMGGESHMDDEDNLGATSPPEGKNKKTNHMGDEDHEGDDEDGMDDDEDSMDDDEGDDEDGMDDDEGDDEDSMDDDEGDDEDGMDDDEGDDEGGMGDDEGGMGGMGDKKGSAPSGPKEDSPIMKAMKNNPVMMKRMMGQW
jgi:hypothetical protein